MLIMGQNCVKRLFLSLFFSYMFICNLYSYFLSVDSYFYLWYRLHFDCNFMFLFFCLVFAFILISIVYLFLSVIFFHNGISWIQTNCNLCSFADLNDCFQNTCQNGGVCIDGANSYQCVCQFGFTGTNCQTSKCVPQGSNIGLGGNSTIQDLRIHLNEKHPKRVEFSAFRVFFFLPFWLIGSLFLIPIVAI